VRRFTRDKQPEDAPARRDSAKKHDNAFSHASGAETLKEVIDDQLAELPPEGHIVRPRGRAMRLFPQD
jgi:hypothetical protein